MTKSTFFQQNLLNSVISQKTRVKMRLRCSRLVKVCAVGRHCVSCTALLQRPTLTPWLPRAVRVDPAQEVAPAAAQREASPVPGTSAPSPDPFATDTSGIRRRSVIAANRGGAHTDIDDGNFPTNEQIVQALQVKVAKSVEVARRYRRVLWYSLFVAAYLIVLYLQARAYKSADVVSTLRNALMVDGQLSMTFNNEDEVLAYLANKVLLPTWQDPVCGDGATPPLVRIGTLSDNTHSECRRMFGRRVPVR